MIYFITIVGGLYLGGVVLGFILDPVLDILDNILFKKTKETNEDTN